MAQRSSRIYIIRIVLFILGHLLMFNPPPSRTPTCYNAAPMLWWAVFTGMWCEWLHCFLGSINICLSACVPTVVLCQFCYYVSYTNSSVPLTVGLRRLDGLYRPPA
jgi:hypothetical protein